MLVYIHGDTHTHFAHVLVCAEVSETVHAAVCVATECVVRHVAELVPHMHKFPRSPSRNSRNVPCMSTNLDYPHCLIHSRHTLYIII